MRIIQPLQTGLQPQGYAPEAAENAHKSRFSGQNRMAGSQPVWQPKTPEPASFNPLDKEIPTGVPDEQRLGFKDLIDVINPLQHIPLISTLYRKATGDQISAPAQFMGGMLFGGPLGAAGAMVGMAIKDRTGKSLDENMTALVTDRGGAFRAKDIQLTNTRKHSFESETRMAGTNPVWGRDVALASAVPDKLSDNTRFNLLLQRLEG